MPSPPLASALQCLSPDAAIGLATIGLLFLFLEFNRPGRIYAAALGLLLLLFAVAALSARDVRLAAVLGLGLVVGCFLLNLYRELPLPLLALVTVAGVAALRFLVRSTASPVHLPPAVVCGSILGITSAGLTRIAYRARRAKALN